MSGRILIVALVAVVTYLAIPALAALIARFRLKRLIQRLAVETGIYGVCLGVDRNKVEIGLIPDTQSGAPERRSIDPRETRFFIFDHTGMPEKLDWKTVRLIQRGTPLVLLKGKNRLKRDSCVFHEVKDAKALSAAAKLLLERDGLRIEPKSGLVKTYSVAIGIFLELLLFLESIRHPDMDLVTIAALVGVFAKALPYLPPGLFLTILGAKKNRQRDATGLRGVTGFLMIAIGTLLNLGVVFFAIMRIGFGLP